MVIKIVIKEAVNDQSKEHIQSIYRSYQLLTERYAGSSLAINKCFVVNDHKDASIAFEYVEGKTLEELFDELLLDNDIDAFLELLKEYYRKIDFNNGITVSDYDLIFSNIIVSNKVWTDRKSVV